MKYWDFDIVCNHHFLNCNKIHPLKQRDVAAIVDSASKDQHIKRLVIFGSATTFSCNSYSDIDLTFVEASTSSTLHPTWVNAYINTVNIKEGKNLIRLLVNNSNANSVGTIKAQGPIVDCITIKSTSELVMTTYSN